jgi:hypothetical protein
MDAVSKYKPKQANENKLKYYLSNALGNKEVKNLKKYGKFNR